MSIWTDEEGFRHVAIMVNGKRIHRRMQKGATASDAKRLEAELRAGIESKPRAVVESDPPLIALLAEYLEYANKSLRSPETAAFHARRIGPWAERYKASQARECAAHIVKDMTGAYKPATINRSLGTLKKAVSLAFDRGAISQNYGMTIKRLPENNQRMTTATLEQVAEIASHASEQVRAAIWIALYTACRRGEIVKMRAEDIGGATITIQAGNTKTLKTRVIPIALPLRPWLEYVPLKLNEEGLKTGFKRAREKAGLEHINFHDLRRTCGTMMIEAGVDVFVVSKILGHSSVMVTEKVYAHLRIGRMTEGLNKTFG